MLQLYQKHIHISLFFTVYLLFTQRSCHWSWFTERYLDSTHAQEQFKVPEKSFAYSKVVLRWCFLSHAISYSASGTKTEVKDLLFKFCSSVIHNTALSDQKAPTDLEYFFQLDLFLSQNSQFCSSNELRKAPPWSSMQNTALNRNQQKHWQLEHHRHLQESSKSSC